MEGAPGLTKELITNVSVKDVKRTVMHWGLPRDTSQVLLGCFVGILNFHFFLSQKIIINFGN